MTSSSNKQIFLLTGDVLGQNSVLVLPGLELQQVSSVEHAEIVENIGDNDVLIPARNHATDNISADVVFAVTHASKDVPPAILRVMYSGFSLTVFVHDRIEGVMFKFNGVYYLPPRSDMLRFMSEGLGNGKPGQIEIERNIYTQVEQDGTSYVIDGVDEVIDYKMRIGRRLVLERESIDMHASVVDTTSSTDVSIPTRDYTHGESYNAISFVISHSTKDEPLTTIQIVYMRYSLLLHLHDRIAGVMVKHNGLYYAPSNEYMLRFVDPGLSTGYEGQIEIEKHVYTEVEHDGIVSNIDGVDELVEYKMRVGDTPF
jgi:hypothetical protein